MRSVLKTGSAGDEIALSELPVGAHGRLCAPPAGSEISRRLGDLGFVPGTRIAVVRRAPLGDPVELDLRGYRLCLRLAQLAGLRVRLEPNGDDA
jgi:ferrous iron transport protein A